MDYKLFHWNNYKEIKNISKEELSKYDLIINIHPQFSWITKTDHERMINFIHGSEILMTSPSLLNRVYKRIMKQSFFNKTEKSYLNIFISEATLDKAKKHGFNVDYSRDLIMHNCINTTDALFIKKEIKYKLVFTCIVRNVAHKNLLGSLKFCELVALVTSKEVELIVPKGSNLKSEKIKIRELTTVDNNERDEAYKASHYNLLLSEDHSHKGFFEGFGLTVLEAGRFGTPSIVFNAGGLPEAVHHGKTGWVIDNISNQAIKQIFNKENDPNYQQMAIECFSHTTKSHSLNEYSKLFQVISKQREAA